MEYKNINVETFRKLSEKPGNIILDVRPEEEHVEGKIPNHVLINYFDSDFEAQLLDKLDRNANYLVYCRSGNRSGKACQLMSEIGFTGELYNLDGGIKAWNDAYAS